MSGRRRWSHAVGVTVLVAGLALTAWAQISGLRAVPVLSGSMAPYAAQGSLVLTQPVSTADVRVGDVVAFVPPAPYARDKHPVMHRVATLDLLDGAPVMTTRGDANPQADPWHIAVSGADLGLARAVVPWVGWAVMAGPIPAVLALLGLAAAGEGLALMRRPACTCADAPVDDVVADSVVRVRAEELHPDVRIVPVPALDIPILTVPVVAEPAARAPAEEVPAEEAAAGAVVDLTGSTRTSEPRFDPDGPAAHSIARQLPAPRRPRQTEAGAPSPTAPRP